MTMSEAFTILGEEKKFNGKTKTKVRCECGVIKYVIKSALLNGKVESCGCLKRKNSSISQIKHGATKKNHVDHRLYKIWLGMKSRCSNPNVKAYKWYGGKGIEVCTEWKDSFVNFRDWSKKNGYTGILTIDRISPNGNYEPNNCRWVDMTTQANNKTNNLYLVIDGKKKTASQWAKEYGILPSTIEKRYHHYGCRGKDLIAPVKSKSWSDEEIKILKERWIFEETKNLIGELGRTTGTINSMARRLGLKKAEKIYRVTKDGSLIIEGDVEEIAKKLGVKKKSVENFRNKPENHRKLEFIDVTKERYESN